MNLPYGGIFGFFSHVMATHFAGERQRKESASLHQITEAVERLDFVITPERDIVNQAGEELNAEQKVQLLVECERVKAEWAERAELTAWRRAQAKRDEEARKKEAYDAAAAPYREARRLKKLQSFNQRNPQEEKTQP